MKKSLIFFSLALISFLVLIFNKSDHQEGHKDAILREFKDRIIESELLDDIIPSYNSRRKFVNAKMTIEDVFTNYCGKDIDIITWTVVPAEDLENSDMGVAMGNTVRLALSAGDERKLKKTDRDINDKRFNPEIYGIKVEINKSYAMSHQKPYVGTYQEGFLFDRRDKKIKHLLLGFNGINMMKFPENEEGQEKWK